MIDELPLLSRAEPRRDPAQRAASPPARRRPSLRRPAAASVDWLSSESGQAGRFLVESVWAEIRSLVRITRIDHPEAMLVAPEQAFFLRRTSSCACSMRACRCWRASSTPPRAICAGCRAAIERYCDRSSKRTQIVLDLVGQVMQQARQSAPARPDDTFAALAAAGAARWRPRQPASPPPCA